MNLGVPMSNHTTRIQKIANLFIQKYHSNDFSNGLVNYGVVRQNVGFTHIDRDFFFADTLNDFSVDDFEIFKSFLYGVGHLKFRYNEHVMNDYNHSECKNVFDIFMGYQVHTKDHDNTTFDFYSLWIKLFDGEQVQSVVISDTGSAVTYRIAQIISQQASLLLEPFNTPEDEALSTTQLILKDYHQSVLFSAQNDLKKAYNDLNSRLSLQIKEHFKNKMNIIVDDSADDIAYIFPSREIASMVSVDTFYDDLKYFEVVNIKALYDFIDNQTQNINVFVENTFQQVFNQHKSIIDKTLELQRNSTYLIVKDDKKGS